MAYVGEDTNRGYNNPNDTSLNGNPQPSDIGPQARTDHWLLKKSLIEARRLQYFMPLADVENQPKHMGKTMKLFQYMPLLDVRNINDQGIDAAGAVITQGTYSVFQGDGEGLEGVPYTDGDDVDANGYYPNLAAATAALTKYNATNGGNNRGSMHVNGGNLYGSSKDPGTIAGKLPTIGANGGRKNRVGWKREEIKGSIEKMGFFDDYNQESMDFDSDADLKMHVNREMLNGATEMTEDALQIDLLTQAGTEHFAGDAMNMSEVSGAKSELVTYADLLALSVELDQLRTPKQTKIITGTRFVDTRTISGGRVMYIGSELQHTFEAMKDLHQNPAFIHVHQYAAGGTTMNGEIGTVGHFRIVVVPEMMKYEGKGASSDGVDDAHESNGFFDVFPMLCVGEGSFSTIGFQTDGKTVKFKIIHKPPGEETADRSEPFGEVGFMSIKWYYGFLPKRLERIGKILTGALL